MVFDKLFRLGLFFRRRELEDVLAELVHLLICLGALNGQFFQMGCVCLDIDRSARLCEDRLLGKVREYDHQRERVLAVTLIGETATYNPDCIKTIDTTIRTVNIKFALIHI